LELCSDRPETSTSVVRVRGVPWNCTQEDLKKFFGNLEIEEAHFDVAPSGRLTGDAYVKFASSSSADEAVKHDRQVSTRPGEALLGSEGLTRHGGEGARTHRWVGRASSPATGQRHARRAVLVAGRDERGGGAYQGRTHQVRAAPRRATSMRAQRNS